MRFRGFKPGVSAEYGRSVHGIVGVVCIPRELRPSHCHRDDRHCCGCRCNKLAARSSLLHGVTSPGGCGGLPGMEHRQQSDLQGIACRCHMACFRQRPIGRWSKHLYRYHPGSELAIVAQHGGNAACRLFLLWHQPDSFRSCTATYWNGQNRGLLLCRPVFWNGVGNPASRRSGRRTFNHCRSAHGFGHLAAFDRTTRTRTFARSEGA